MHSCRSAVIPDDIVAEARSWLGTPYRHQASLKHIACDCIGYCAGVAANCGVREAAAWAADQRRGSYARSPDVAMLRAAAGDYLDEIPRADAGAGDLFLMRLRRLPQHFAICAGETILHAYASVGRVVEHRLDDVWRRRIIAAYRFR